MDQLEKTLNLENLRSALKKIKEKNQNEVDELDESLSDDDYSSESIQTAISTADELNHELSNFNVLHDHDNDMDQIADEALKYYKEISVLGLSVDEKSAGAIIDAGNHALQIALEAKHQKTEKKLKVLELQIKKLRIEKMKGISLEELPNQLDDGLYLDRNKILEAKKEEEK